MQTVAILGAGDLGGALARTLAQTGAVRRILLVDAAAAVAAGKALDIQQSGPIDRFDTVLEGTSDVGAIARAETIVFADAHGAGELQQDTGLELVARVSRIATAAGLLFAGAHARPLMARVLRELHLPGSRLVGSAPMAAVASAQALIAPDLDASPRDIAIAVLGAPPAWVVTWSNASVAGAPVPGISPVTCTRVERVLTASWPPGVYSLASAASTAVRAMSSTSRRRFCCFAALEAGGVQRAIAAAPVTLQPGGVEGIHMPELTVRERVAFESALERSLA